MDLSNILNNLGDLLINNRITLIPIVFIVILLILYIASKAFRKSGLMILAITFAIDYGIRSLPINLYEVFPILNNVIAGMYLLGAIVFVFKIGKILFKTSTNLVKASKYKGKKKGFFAYTGSLAFIIMVLVNIIDSNNYIPQEIKSLLTSLSFLYMIFRTLFSTYKHLNDKDVRLINDKMEFDDIDEYLNVKKEDLPKKNSTRRRIRRKNLDDDIKIYDGLDNSHEYSNANDYDSKVRDDFFEETSKEEKIEEIERELSNTDIIHLATRDDSKAKNFTTLKITNINTGDSSSYTSKNAKFKMVEEKEYKVDLEFEQYNDYDYGRFIDILIMYSKDRDKYKFELIVEPSDMKHSKIVLYDPSNIFDFGGENYQNIGGRIISMNFPKYKINFITGN
ncbi:hypothetical protein [uncultured Anaerococcus sp.]|uniref:hypothetical protein n=1 Tax=uncultured Anaerococcus sp. TaxID=293428 RepID=UPI00280A9D0B|nr:hypothetical protein [uncultured Anaerococcus sp.]MDU5148802.1 hypothetical protein [Anaerococcus prevotii]